MIDEKVKNLTQAFWNLMAAFGLCVAAVWTLFTFETLGLRKRAESEQLRLDADNEEREKRNRILSAVSVDIAAKPLAFGGESVLSIEATFKNSGTGIAVVRPDRPPIVVARLEFDADHQPVVRESHDTYLYFLDNRFLTPDGYTIMPGESKQFRAMVPVRRNGLYVVTFIAPRPLPEQWEAQRHGLPRAAQAVLYSSQFVVVGQGS